MKDLHSHILFGIDDGSNTLTESIKTLKSLEKSGVTELMLTPHYIKDTNYNCNNNNKLKLLELLKEKALENNINIKLYLGNEVFFTNDFLELIEKDEIMTLNNSKYLLFEFSMTNIYSNALMILNNFISKGYIPIMAHPERYQLFIKDPDLVKEYLNSGVLLQGNLTSLFGKYGSESEKTLKYFLKNKWISFLGSDTHHQVLFNSKKLEKILYRVTKDKEYVEKLMNLNFDKIINNEDIEMVR